MTDALHQLTVQLAGEKARSESWENLYNQQFKLAQDLRARAVAAEDILTWIEAWVSQPVTAFSVDALTGLFAMARERIGERIRSIP
jgi:hypothetical protein